MDTMSAFARGKASRGQPMMVFDWAKAARLIVEAGCKEASAGLASDWEYTGGAIYEEGKPVTSEERSTYLASSWAHPQICIGDRHGDGELQECWVLAADTDGWHEHTFWPPLSLSIINGETTK